MSIERYTSITGLHLNPGRTTYSQIKEFKTDGLLFLDPMKSGVTTDISPEPFRGRGNRLVTAELSEHGAVTIGISTINNHPSLSRVDLFGLAEVRGGQDMVFPREDGIIMFPHDEHPFYLLAGSPPLLYALITSFDSVRHPAPKDQFSQLGLIV